MSNSKRSLTTREICLSAILIAIAFVISEFIPFIKLPYGGKLTYCSMLFVCLIGYFFGPKTGLIASLAYGLLQLIMGSSIVHPVQLILDYPLAYTCLGICGFFHNKKNGLAIGYILSVLGRYICHVISGIVFFGEYAEGNVIIYSLGYNLTYILPEAILSLLLIALLSNTFKRLKVSLLDTSTVSKGNSNTVGEAEAGSNKSDENVNNK